MATPVRRLFRPTVSPPRPSPPPTTSPTYRPRRPTATPLYPVVQHHLELFLARPPFALERLHALTGVVSLASPDGRTELVLSPLQLLERLVAFVPPPRVHRHRYHGVLAPHAALRSAVVAIGRVPGEGLTLPAPAEAPRPGPGAQDEPSRSPSPARIRWAVLLARIYEVLPLLCPGHRAKRGRGGSMRILAFLTDPPLVSAILLHLELPHRPPAVAPARGPPQRRTCSKEIIEVLIPPGTRRGLSPLHLAGQATDHTMVLGGGTPPRRGSGW